MSRGPYRRRPKLKVPELEWGFGDLVTVGTVRWIIRHLTRDGQVELVSSNSLTCEIKWTTTLDKLPPKKAHR